VFGRRNYGRFNFDPSPAGTLRVLRDVIVQQIDGEGLTVISADAASIGDSLTLQLGGADANRQLRVCVTECRPVLVDGAMQHCLRLRPVESDVTSMEPA
jgi:hypothetical protein